MMRGWILDVACPYCGVARGRQCRTRPNPDSFYKSHTIDKPHDERVHAARVAHTDDVAVREPDLGGRRIVIPWPSVHDSDVPEEDE